MDTKTNSTTPRVYRGPKQTKRNYLQILYPDTARLDEMRAAYLAKQTKPHVLNQPEPHVTLLYGINPNQFDAIADAVDADLESCPPLSIDEKKGVYLVSPANRDRDFVCVDIASEWLNQKKQDWANLYAPSTFVVAHVTLLELARPASKGM
jgi:hypothetical protein